LGSYVQIVSTPHVELKQLTSEYLELEDEYWRLEQKLDKTRDEETRELIQDALDELLDEILFVEEELEQLRVQCKQLEIGVESDYGECRRASGRQNW
jgi:predicted nuclease with TOPRIM domain